MTLDTYWARQELVHFLDVSTTQRGEARTVRGDARMVLKGGAAAVIDSAHVVEQILDRLLPQWRTLVPPPANEKRSTLRWTQHREAARRAITVIDRQEEVQERLGDNAPQISASALHPWAWEGARSLWQSGHYREAVNAAARKVNAETQNKVGRRDVQETQLFKESFSPEPPKPGRPRLRLMTDDGSRTFSSLHRGVAAFAEGCYAAIRNPASHEDGLPELAEAEALEQLSAFSVLARWVDDAVSE